MAKELAIDVDIPVHVDTDEFHTFVACVDNILNHGCGYGDEATDHIVEKCHTSDLPIAKKVLRECRRISRNTSGIRPSRSKWWETYYKNKDVPRWPGRKPDHERGKRPMSPMFDKTKRGKRPMSPMFNKTKRGKRPMSPMFDKTKREKRPRDDGRNYQNDRKNNEDERTRRDNYRGTNYQDDRRNYDRRNHDRRNYQDDRRNYHDGRNTQYQPSPVYERNSKKRKYR